MEENGSAPGTGEAKRSAAAPADPEVVDRPLRRRFSPSYKLRIVEEADRCTEPGEVGQLLRREGLYSSHLTTWRKAAHSGSLKALSKKRGRKPERNPLDEKVRKLERRNARLENELRKAHLIIDVQGKVAGLLGNKPRRRDKLLKAADELAKHVGVKPACAALEVSRSTLYRRRGPSTGQQQPRPTPAPGIERDGTRRGLRHAVFGAVRGPLTRRGGGHAARRRGLPVQRTHDVSCSGLRGAGSGTPGAAHPSRVQEARVDGHGAEPGVVLGYHAAASGRRSGAITTSTSSWTSTAATSWAGWWRTGRTRPWPAG